MSTSQSRLRRHLALLAVVIGVLALAPASASAQETAQAPQNCRAMKQFIGNPTPGVFQTQLLLQCESAFQSFRLTTPETFPFLGVGPFAIENDGETVGGGLCVQSAPNQTTCGTNEAVAAGNVARFTFTSEVNPCRLDNVLNTVVVGATQAGPEGPGAPTSTIGARLFGCQAVAPHIHRHRHVHHHHRHHHHHRKARPRFTG